MNLKIFTLAFLVIIHCKLFSQRRVLPEDTRLSLAECLTIDIDSLVFSPAVSRPFSAIVVADERFDRTKLGYFYAPKKNELLKMCTKKNTAEGVADFLNNYFSRSSSQATDSVFVHLKKLWIKNDDPYANGKDAKISGYSIRLKAEFYLKRESCFYPLYRFDSTLYVEGTSEKAPGMLIRKGLTASVRKLNTSLFPAQGLSCLSLSQIDSFNRASRNIPILKEVTPRKGIYLTFNEFRNNQPAFTDFKISFEERSDFLSISGKAINDSIVNDAWGFSDGTTIFIRHGKNFFPLFRAGGNFEFYAFNKITVDKSFPYPYYPSYQRGNNVANVINNGTGLLLSRITTKSKSSDIRLYTLDIETGKIY